MLSCRAGYTSAIRPDKVHLAFVDDETCANGEIVISVHSRSAIVCEKVFSLISPRISCNPNVLILAVKGATYLAVVNTDVRCLDIEHVEIPDPVRVEVLLIFIYEEYALS